MIEVVRRKPRIVSVLATLGLHSVLILVLFAITPALRVSPQPVTECSVGVTILADDPMPTATETETMSRRTGDNARSNGNGSLREEKTSAGDTTQPAGQSAALPSKSDGAIGEIIDNALPRRTAIALPSVGNTNAGSLTGLRGGMTKSGEDDPAILAADREAMEARKPVGPVGQVSIFGSAPAQGRSFVFVIDRSKSMGAGGLNILDKAEQELIRALDGLEPTHRFQIIAYHDQCTYLGKPGHRLIPVNEQGRAQVGGFLTSLAAFGGTNHLKALMAALALRPDVVFLLTDGGDPYLNDNELQYVIKESGPRIQFHTIQFGIGGKIENDFMAKLARASGGQFRYVDVGGVAPRPNK